MDIKELKKFENYLLEKHSVDVDDLIGIKFVEDENEYKIVGANWAVELEDACTELNVGWDAWQAAKAQAVPEQDQQVWATSNLTWKDIAFRALTCKVLKSTENWVHVKNIACVGSTTASLICKKLGVDPDGTKFELIEAQEPAK